MSRISELRIEREDIQKRLWATQNDADKRALARKVAQLGVKTIEDSRRPVESSRPNHAFAASLSQAEIDELKAIEEQSRRKAAWQERQRQAAMRNTTVESVREEHKREDVLCNVCQVEPLSNPEIVAELGCGHRMCRPCIERCIDFELGKSHKKLDTIKCPLNTNPSSGIRCDHVITRQEILKFGTQAHAKKYDEYAKKDSAQNQTVDEDSSEAARTEEWKKQKTKPCPGCKNAIEINWGCNHMTCTFCNTEFCYKCGGPFDKGGRYGERYGPFRYGCDSYTCNGNLDARMEEERKARMQEHRDAGRTGTQGAGLQVGTEVEKFYRDIWYHGRIVRRDIPRMVVLKKRRLRKSEQDKYIMRFDDGDESLPTHISNIRVLNKATIKRCPQCGRTPEEFEDYYNDYGKYNKDCCGDKFHPRTG